MRSPNPPVQPFLTREPKIRYATTQNPNPAMLLLKPTFEQVTKHSIPRVVRRSALARLVKHAACVLAFRIRGRVTPDIVLGQQFLDLPIVRPCADRELEVLARDGVPVL